MCAPPRVTARTPPCPVPAHSWVMHTLLDIRAQSPCTEFTVPRTSLHSMLVHVSTPALMSTRTLLLGTVLSLYSTPSSSFGIARVFLFPVSLCLHWTHPFCENSESTSVPGPVLESGGEQLARFELSIWALSIHHSPIALHWALASVKFWVTSTRDEAPLRCIMVLTSWAVPFQVSILGSVHAVCSAPLRCVTALCLCVVCSGCPVPTAAPHCGTHSPLLPRDC